MCTCHSSCPVVVTLVVDQKVNLCVERRLLFSEAKIPLAVCLACVCVCVQMC